MLKIALVYDRVNKWGGAERVLQALHELFPHAPLYTSVYNVQKAPWSQGWDVHSSYLNHLPFASNHHEVLVMFMPRAFQSFDFSGFDLVISVTSAEAKCIRVTPPTKHLCYLLTPTRYLWSHTHQYGGGGLRKALLLPFMSALRRTDFKAAQNPDAFIAISQTVADRCQKYYRRTPQAIIYPSVETESFQSHPTRCFTPRRDYYLVVSRLIPYKNVSLIIETMRALPQEAVVIVGRGSEAGKLKTQAKDLANVHFMGGVSDVKLACLYHHARALLFPQEEDFGIVPVEAQAAGIPVIAWNRGGARETVIPGKTGILYDDQSREGLLAAMTQAKLIKWDMVSLQKQAQKYSQTVFEKQFLTFVEAYV